MIQPILIEVPTIFEAMTVNCWLIKEPEVVLIDCGEKTPAAWEALDKGLKGEGLSIQELDKILITHGHLDHMGMANQIVQQSNAEVWVSELVYPWAVDLKRMLDLRDEALQSAFNEYIPGEKSFKFGYEQLKKYWDEIPKERLHTFSLDETISLGGKDWEVIHTPGHCVNQTCFFQAETGELFSADMLLEIVPPPIVDMSISAPFQRTQSLKMLIESYEKLLKLPIKIAYPGHLNTIENVHETIEKQLKRIQRRKEQCFQLISEGADNLPEIRKRIYPKRNTPPTFLMALGLLDLLRDEGRILVKKGRLVVSGV